MMRSIPTLFLVALAAFTLTGCVHQKVAVKSNPPGARVFFDGYEKGVTPTEFDFTWYGGHKIILEKEGYERVSAVETLKAPPYQYIPVDLISEVLPVPITDRHEFEYDLVPAGESAAPEVLEATAAE